MIRHHAVASANYYLNAKDERDTTLEWQGKMCEDLSLSGGDLQAFRMIAKGKTPHDEKLTQRDRDNATRYFDLTFCEPKSVSIAEQIGGDSRIAEARRHSVNEVMKRYVEPLAATRTWSGRLQRHATTGKLAWIGFEHQLGRPVKGIPDPNGHIHVCVANVTEHKGKRQAIDPQTYVKHLPMIEAAWNSIYARNLRQLGYEIRPTKDAFELRGIGESTVRKFSQRSEIVELEAKLRNIRSPKGRAALGALTREKKGTPPSPEKLQKEWLGRLDKKELDGLVQTVEAARNADPSRMAEPADIAPQVFQRMLSERSAVAEDRLVYRMLKQHPGIITLESAKEEVGNLDALRASIGGVDYLSTKEAMRKEKEVLQAAQDGRITLVRVRRGEKYQLMGKAVLNSPTLDQLHEACQSGDKVTAVYPYRLYTAKGERGNPNHWLEDKGGLSTSQQRPEAKLATRVMRVSAQLRAKVARFMERAARYQELEYERPGAEAVRSRVERGR